MREFRKTRIQREVSELLADVDTWNGAASPPGSLTLKQVGTAFFSLVVGVVLGQSVALTALDKEAPDRIGFQRVVAFDEEVVDTDTEGSGNAYPELPEIKLVYIPNNSHVPSESGQSI